MLHRLNYTDHHRDRERLLAGQGAGCCMFSGQDEHGEGCLEVTATLLHSGCLASVSSSDPKKENANCFHPIFVSHIRRPILGDFMICIETSRNGAWTGTDHNRLLNKVPEFVMS